MRQLNFIIFKAFLSIKKLLFEYFKNRIIKNIPKGVGCRKKLKNELD